MTATPDTLSTYRASADYQRFLHEILNYAGTKVAKAQAELNDAECSRRVDAMIAIRAGYGKAATAKVLGISRPTLNAWIKTVESDPGELAAVLDHEAFVARQHAAGELATR